MTLEMSDRQFDCFFHLRTLPAEPEDTALDDFLFSGPFANLFFVGMSAWRKIFQCRKDALQVQIHIFVRILAQLLQSDPEQEMVGARVEGKDPIEVVQVEGAFFKPEMKLAALQNSAVLVAENRKKHLIAKSLFERIPVDVEELRESRTGAVLQDIHPPLVLRISDAHMIGNEIGDLTHAALVQSRDHGIEILSRPNRGVQFVMIADVVSMIAVRARAEER